MKILNLYACLGGNRLLWNEVADVKVTAVELDEDLASLYAERFKDDTVIVGDAHEYLLKHYEDYDFIWSSPPCPTHSRARYWAIGANGKKPVYPDLRLYEEVLFLQHHFKGKYVVENVLPYYEPMLNPKIRNRHIYFTNFNIPYNLGDRTANVCQGKDELERLCEFHKFDFNKYQGKQRKLKIARNLVDYNAGKKILETALNIIKSNDDRQTRLF